jgi:hypothetical protein
MLLAVMSWKSKFWRSIPQQLAFISGLFKGHTMDKNDIYDILAAVAVGLMLAFFLTVRG